MDQPTTIQHLPTQDRWRWDAKQEAYVAYAPSGRIEFLPEQNEFRLSWESKDGTRHQIDWALPNKLSAVVEAVSPLPSSGAS